MGMTTSVLITAWDGSLGRLGGEPATLAKAVGNAVTTGRSRTRDPLPPSARLFLERRALLPRRTRDTVVGSSVPRAS